MLILTHKPTYWMYIMAKISTAEINKQVQYISSLIAKFDVNLANDYITKPFHRDMNITAFVKSLGHGAISTEVLCRHIDLSSQIQFGV